MLRRAVDHAIEYELYYANDKGRSNQVRLYDIINADNDIKRTYQVIGIYPPGSKKGGVTGKVACVSSDYTTHLFYPHIANMRFYCREAGHRDWTRVDRYGRLVDGKQKGK